MKHLDVMSGSEGDAASAAPADDPATSATAAAAKPASTRPALVVGQESLSVPPSVFLALRLDDSNCRRLREALLLLFGVAWLRLLLLLAVLLRSRAVTDARFEAAKEIVSCLTEGGELDKNASERAARDAAIAHRARLGCNMFTQEVCKSGDDQVKHVS